MRVYFSHPTNTYGSTLESDLIAHIQHSFCGAEVINPASGEYCKGWANHGVAFFDGQMLPMLDCAVFLPFQDGKFGSPAVYEIRKTLASGKPCWSMAYTRELSSFSVLDEALCLTAEETIDRTCSSAGEAIPYVLQYRETVITSRLVCVEHGYQEHPTGDDLPLCPICSMPLLDDSEVKYEPADVATRRIFSGVRDGHFSQKDVLTQLVILANAIRRSPGLIEALAEFRHTFSLCNNICIPDKEVLMAVVGDLCRAYSNLGQMSDWINTAGLRLLEWTYDKLRSGLGADVQLNRMLPQNHNLRKIALLVALNEILPTLGLKQVQTVQGTIPCLLK